ncbi:HAMP domain-containing protein [Allonocardiopsis opalescens]|uniref:Circadian input-output histidine kinase CikA n=1 Tax=Allonocardiopsis opalescens TaxID=1144618 RepID=A0A2T0Q9P6_9ACTN|nr:HAMP domain-containing protein [Allonocardiopsis opalescens]PRY00565.1 GAF sensor hybrid histidine kinase [Allonocardiopsis opalescens]
MAGTIQASEDLDRELRDLLAALVAARDGDFSVRLDPGAGGTMGEIARAYNDVVERNQGFCDELTRVGRIVGREGRLDDRVNLNGASGSWADGAWAVNQLLDDVSRPVTSVALVLDAVADGDLSQRVDPAAGGQPLGGELLRLGSSLNRMMDQLSSFTGEVTRVAREVGTEGKLGGRANVRGVSGAWKDVTESVNRMAGRLTAQVRDIAVVTTAVARGDLTRKVTVDVQGEMLELKNTVNTMVDQLSSFADEVTRVAREVGTEGKLGGRANVKGVSGIWKDLTGNVNSMADNLTYQVRNIAVVTTAVARGDLTRKVTVDVQGEMLELKNTVNTMVDQLSSFADEVTRVAREVGTEGKLGGRANVRGVSGIWKDLTDNVNSMANNLTYQVRNIAQVTTAVAEGDLSKKITVDAQGEMLQLKDTINTMVDQLSTFADEVTRMAREVGTEGKLGGQAQVRGVSGIWKDLTDNVNSMANNLTSQVRNIANVAMAVAQGDLTKKITADAHGEILQLKDTMNTMVDKLSAFADEVTRVAREVGTEGKLGGRANVRGVSGIWKDLTDNVNSMANNLTHQVRNIAQVTTAVARGDLSKKITVDAQGEVLQLKDTINTMVDQLSTFANEVTRVAYDVSVEGQLGGQARVEGVSGTWKQLTESVNELAGNLTTQVRAIATVTSAVTRGDLTQSIKVAARGEIAELKDNVNTMVVNLRETTRANEEQDWLKSNLARISGLMQAHRDLNDLAQLIMGEVTPLVSAQVGAFFFADSNDGPPTYRLLAGYGYQPATLARRRIVPGDGLTGQAVLQKERLIVDEVPPGYVTVASGLGEAGPASLVILPILSGEHVLGVIELASFGRFSEIHLAFLDQFVDTIGVTITTIMANSRTEDLLAESQRLTRELQERSAELQRQQGELRRKNTELSEKAAMLASQNRAIELQNNQIEQARRALEERARQLALSYKYKSQFLANMSHELRTPLNSLLILAKLLAENSEQNLTAKQVEFAHTIHSAGSDLLQLINDILDLSKVEAGRMEVNPVDLPISQLVDYVEATFRPLTSDKGLAFTVDVSPDVPDALFTDEQRLQQIVRNLLSNAVKFTAQGEIRLLIEPAGPMPMLEGVDAGSDFIAISVADTGIGISEDKFQVIFEAFHQGEGNTSRRFGGTGLGLSISREIARLLGGGIQVDSVPGQGSTFTLFLPVRMAEGEPQPAPAPVTGSVVELAELPARPDDIVADRPRAEAPPAPEPRADLLVEPSPVRADVERDRTLAGKRVLIVDDDVRNVFALASALEAHGIEVLYADSGPDGIEKLERDENIALVLMDIMMPELDGNETTAAIRQMPQFAHLPIISLTAKAMQGDREKSLASGASDYVTKPVNIDHLLDVIQSWLSRDPGEPGTNGDGRADLPFGGDDATDDGPRETE